MAKQFVQLMVLRCQELMLGDGLCVFLAVCLGCLVCVWRRVGSFYTWHCWGLLEPVVLSSTPLQTGGGHQRTSVGGQVLGFPSHAATQPLGI